GECGVDVRVEADVGQVVIVQPGTAELGVLEVEAERLDEVEVGTGDGGQPYRVAGVAGDHGLVEEDVDLADDSLTRSPRDPSPQRERAQRRSRGAGRRGAFRPGNAKNPDP